MKISIVIPCYNEENGIEPLISQLRSMRFPEGTIEWIFVQNGSLDQTGAKLREFTASSPEMLIVEVPVNLGYGYGIKQDLKAATGDYLGWIHADLQFSPKEIETAYSKLEELNAPNNIFMKGLRINRPFGDCVFTLGMSCYETLLLRCVLHDINAQPCIFSRDIYSEWDNLAPDDFSLDLYAYYLAKKSMAKIVRWKVRQSERKNGVSTWNTGMSARWWLIRKTIAFSRKLKNEL